MLATAASRSCAPSTTPFWTSRRRSAVFGRSFSVAISFGGWRNVATVHFTPTSHGTRLRGLRVMEPFFFTADFWALAWTALATVVLLLVPGVVYAYYVLDRWIDDDASYLPVMASVDQPIRSAGSTTH